jgi:hypothetical protein
MSNQAIAQRRLPTTLLSASEAFVRPQTGPLAAAVARAAVHVKDGLMLLAVILVIPFVILAVGIPLALVVQLLLWIGRLL